MPYSSADGHVVANKINNTNSVSKRLHHKYYTKSQTSPLVRVAMIASTLAVVAGRAVAFSSNNARSTFLRRHSNISRQWATKGLCFDAPRYTRGLFMAAMTEADEAADIDIDRTWNLGGLRKEVTRLTLRCHKKTGKANQRLQKAQDEVERLTGSDDVSMEELEKCPNLDELEAQVEELRTRLAQLNQLEELLADVKGKNVVLPEEIASLAIALEVNDEPPKRQERGPKKKKGPRVMNSFRLPYRRFYTANKTEIRVSVSFFSSYRLPCPLQLVILF